MRAHPTFKPVRLMVRVACIISYNNARSLREGLHEGGHARDRETITIQRMIQSSIIHRANTPTEISFYEIVFLFFCERRFLSRKTPISHVRTIQRLRMCREAIQRRHRRSVNARLSRLPRLTGLQGQEITLKRRWTVWHYASYWPTYHSVTFPPTKRVRYVGETGEKWATRVERS